MQNLPSSHLSSKPKNVSTYCANLCLLDLGSAEEHYQRRVTRILTMDLPQYFAVITRIRQESNGIGIEGGVISSTVVPQVQAIFPEGSLTKNIKVGLQVICLLLSYVEV